MLQDLRTAVRVIAGDRWFSAAAVVALALGIGLNATVFTPVNAVLIIPRPSRPAGRRGSIRRPCGAGVRIPVRPRLDVVDRQHQRPVPAAYVDGWFIMSLEARSD
jgi:hypothetical protein